MQVDYALCNPFRTTFLGGQVRLHHDNENDEQGFYDYWWRGYRTNSPLYGRPRQWSGLLFQDLALQYAHQRGETYDQYYLPQSHWPNAGVTNNVRKGVSYGPGTVFNSSMTGKTVEAVDGSGIQPGTTATYVNPYTLTLSLPATLTKTTTLKIDGGTWKCPGVKLTTSSVTATSLCYLAPPGSLGSAGDQGTIGKADNEDHLQAFSGNLFTWLRHAGVQKIGLYGKVANCMGASTANSAGRLETAQIYGDGYGQITDEAIPPGITDCCIITGDAGASGDIQDHWHMSVVEYHAAGPNDNPAWGNGALGVRRVYRYNHCIDNIAWDAANSQLVVTISNDPTFEVVGPGGATTQCDGDCSFSAHELEMVEVGEEVSITGCSQTAYNNERWIIDSITADVIRISHDALNVAATNHGTVAGGANVQASPQSLFSDRVLGKKVIQFYESCKDSDNFFVYFPSRMCHAQVAGPGVPGLSDQTDTGGIGFEEEIRYINKVDGTGQAYYWGGIQGAVSPAVPLSVLTGPGLPDSDRKIWERRSEMNATFNDVMWACAKYCDDRWTKRGHNFMFSTDNAFELNDHKDTETNSGARVAAKGYVYLGSTLCRVYGRGPDMPTYGDVDYPVGAQDLTGTILDMFARKFPKLKYHHHHFTGDGVSLQRKAAARLQGDNPINRMAQLTMGWYQEATGGDKHSPAVLDQDYFKYVQRIDGSGEAVWNVRDIRIVNISVVGTTATVTTERPHGRFTNDYVWIKAVPDAFSIAGKTGSSSTMNNNAKITVLDNYRFTYTVPASPGVFGYGTLFSDWETKDVKAAYPNKWAELKARLALAKVSGFDVTTRIAALECSGSGSDRLDLDGNPAPAGNRNTYRTF